MSGSNVMQSRLTLIFILLSGTVIYMNGQVKPSQKPYILEIDGACYPNELSIEFFITGKFGGYSSFIKTDARRSLYEVPTVRDGMPATSLKLMIRGARCRTKIIDVPKLELGGTVIRTRLRRARMIEFRGRIASPGHFSRKDTRLTVEYWAHWKCEFMGVPDCMIGPNAIDNVEFKRDGQFRVSLPDLVNDPALSAFSNKGSFQFFIRDRKTGNILYDLTRTGGGKDLAVAMDYPQENEFVAVPHR